MTYSLTRVSAPAASFLTLDEAKRQVFYTGTAQDTHIQSLVDTAVEMLDGPRGLLGRSIITQQWELKLDSFFSPAIRLPLGPVSAIDSVIYVDENGSTQTLASSVYTLDESHGVHYLALAYNQQWPNTRRQTASVTITYTAGYGAASAVPDGVKQLAKYVFAEMYYQRQMTRDNFAKDAVVEALVGLHGLHGFGNV